MIFNLIVLFLILTIFHFLYEGIIAPSIRLKLKYNLFAIRDQLRALLREPRVSQFSEDVYSHLQSSINNLIKFLPVIDILSIAKAEQKFNEDETLRQEVMRVTRMLEDCKSPDVQEIRSRIRRIFAMAIFVNNGMLMFYSFPIVILSASAKAFFKKIVSAIQELLYMPESEFGRLMPLQIRSHGLR